VITEHHGTPLLFLDRLTWIRPFRIYRGKEMELRWMLLAAFVLGCLVMGLAFWLTRRRRASALQAVDQTGRDRSRGHKRTQSLPSLIIEAVDGKPMMSVTPLPSETFDLVSGPGLRTPEKISGLNALLQAAPTVAARAQGVSANVYEVSINGALINAKDASGQVMEGAYRAMSQKAGKISEHATLTKPDVSKLLSAAAVWQVASVIVAQKHLADISQRLDDIQQGVTDVINRLDDGRLGSILGILSYAKQMSTSVMEGELTQSTRNSLEEREADLLKISYEIERILARKLEDIRSIKDPDTFKATGFRNRIDAAIDELSNLYTQALLCHRARLQVWSLVAMFPGDTTLKGTRLQEVRKAFDGLADDSPHGISRFQSSFEPLIHQLHSRLQSAGTLATYRNELTAKVREVHASVQNRIEQELVLVARSQEMLRDQDRPSRLLVREYGGQITDVKYLDAAGQAGAELFPHVTSGLQAVPSPQAH
jgi:hypothetical protein